MQERRVLVCRFGDDPNIVDILGIKNKWEFKKYAGVNHHLESSVTLRIKSCEFSSTCIEIDITHVGKKTIRINDQETSIQELQGNLYVCKRTYIENDKKRQTVFERKDLKTTVSSTTAVLSPKQIVSRVHQSISFENSVPAAKFENFFDYLKSEVDEYNNQLSLKENNGPLSFHEPISLKRKIALA